MKKTVTETGVGCVVRVEGDYDEVKQWCDGERAAGVTVEFVDGATRDRKNAAIAGMIPSSQGIATYVDIDAQAREATKASVPRYPDI